MHNDRFVISKRSEKSFNAIVQKKDFSSCCSKRVTCKVMTQREICKALSTYIADNGEGK